LNRLLPYLLVLANFFCFISESTGQYSISGFIHNKSNEPLAYANVQLESEQSIVAFSTTDSTGFYILELDSSFESLELSVSFIGFKSQSKKLDTLQLNEEIQLDFILEDESYELKSIELVAEKVLAKINEDTISYDISTVTDGTEQNLKDIIQKLPGLSIDDHGKIKVGGKKVDYLLINGEKFFPGQEQLATNNLPASIVSNIDLIKNYKGDESISLSDEGMLGLNINIKEEFRGKLNGRISALGGVNNKYDGKGNLFLFKDKLNISFLSNVNNLGRDALSLQDYISLKGGIQEFTNKSKSSVSILNDDLPDFVLEDSERMKNKTSHFAGYNMTYNVNPQLKIKSYAFLNNSIRNKYEETKQYFIASEQSLIDKKDKQKIDLSILNFHGELVHNKDQKTLVNYQIDLENDNDNINRDINLLGSINNHINETFQNNGFRFSQKLQYFHKANVLWNINLLQSIRNSDDNISLNSATSLFQGLFNSSEVNQAQTYKQQKISANYGFQKQLSKNLISFYFTNKYSQNEISNLIDNGVDSTQYNEFKPLENNFDFSFAKTNGSFQYDLKLSGHHVKSQLDAVKRSSSFLTYSLYSKLEFSKSHYLGIKYMTDYSLPGVRNLNSFTTIKDYRTVIDPSLIEGNSLFKYGALSLEYFNFNLFDGRMTMLHLNYLNHDNSIQKDQNASVEFDRFSYFNSDFSSSVNALFLLSQKIPKVPLTFTIKMSFNSANYVSKINAESNELRFNDLTSDFNINSTAQKSMFNFSGGVKYQQLRNTFKAFDRTNSFYAFLPYFELRAKLFQNAFVGSINTEFVINNIPGRQTKQFILNPSLNYNLNNHFQIYLEGRNILQIKSLERIGISTNETLIEETIYFPLEGYIGLGVKYLLRGF